MPESGLFSGLSVVIPMVSDEDPAWVSDIIATARYEANEIIVVLESRADATSIRPSLGAFGEKVRFVYQTGNTKADALNRGLIEAKNVHVVFLDVDVALEVGQLTADLDMLQDPEDPVDFVSVSYSRVPNFAPIGFVSGWFFAARRSTFIEVGGWAEGFVEDVETAKRISRSGHKIRIAGFTVKLRRPVRNPGLKFISIFTSFGHHR